MRKLLVLLLPALAALGGCVIKGSESDVNVAWDFQGLSCADTGVHTVVLTLEGYDAEYDESVYERVSADCADGSITVTDLPAGTYMLDLEGRGGPYDWFEGDEVELYGGQNDFLVHLAAHERP